MTFTMNRTRKLTTVLCFSLAATFVPIAEAEPIIALGIQNVAVTYHSNGVPDTMIINGVNFGLARGAVTLSEIDQTITQWTPTQIVVLVSGAPAPGTYLLEVRRPDTIGAVFHDEMDVTLGTIGPQGPQGLQGQADLQGAPGPAGSQRPIGQTGAQGPMGLTGPQGPQGPQGTAGTSELLGLVYVADDVPSMVIPSGDTGNRFAVCPVGKKVLGGGCAAAFPSPSLIASRPNGSAGWICTWQNPTSSHITMGTNVVYALCATAP